MTDPSLKLIVLKTTDTEALRQFYTQIGFEFAEEQHGSGPVHCSAALGHGVLEIYPLPDGAHADATTRLGFGVANLHSVLTGLGDDWTPKQTEWGLRAVVRDPDGRAVELYETIGSES
ncbi:MAG: hypothetical protein NXI04_01660 [Planctomycetaceae bacterium]|nr:hypothetical protein [Planctomycetaceae bacterium]